MSRNRIVAVASIRLTNSTLEQPFHVLLFNNSFEQAMSIGLDSAFEARK